MRVLLCLVNGDVYKMINCSVIVLDPSPENRNNLEEIFRAQSKTNRIGYFGFGPYSYYVEEMKAAPMR